MDSVAKFARITKVFSSAKKIGSLATLSLECRFALLLFTVGCQQFGEDSARQDRLRQATVKYSLFFRGAVPSTKVKKGAVGSLSVEIRATDDDLVVTGQVSSVVDLGIGGLANKEYRLNENYQSIDKGYNIVTMPLRLQYLAQERRELFAKIDKLLQTIAIQRRSLTAIGNRAYRGFSKLPAIKSDQRTLSGINKQLEVKFAGKSLVNHLPKVRQEVESLARDLRQHVSYRTESVRPLGKNTVIPSSSKIFQQAATLYLRKHPEVKRRIVPFTPKFKSKSKRTGDEHIKSFQQLVSELSTLRQAELLLIRTVYRLYEPIYLSYNFDLMGIKDQLNLSVTSEDRRRTVGKKFSLFRHKIKATSRKHGRFLFGQIDYDREGRVIRFSNNLAPVGRGKLEMVLADLREVRDS